VLLQTCYRVQLDLPSVEVRFEDLHIETSVYTESGRNVPNVLNAYRDIFEWAFLKVRTLPWLCHQSVIVSWLIQLSNW
jgi:hypothetical protein